jgi:hypothetical protein
MSHSLLLRGGILLVHDSDDHVNPIKADLLIEGNQIAKIHPDIRPHARTKVLGEIVSPWFIDGGHSSTYVANSIERKTCESSDYVSTGNMAAWFFTAQDIFWGTLGG